MCCSIYCRVFKLSASNFYCCHFNGRAVPWAFPLEFVYKSRAESRVQCVTNGAEKLDHLAKPNIFSPVAEVR